jgi:signal transduction histidine kinase
MSPADDASDGINDAPLDQLRHHLKTPLTTIHGLAQLLRRATRRSPSLPEDERARMLAAVVAIETAVRAMVPLIDSMGDAGNDGRTALSETGHQGESFTVPATRSSTVRWTCSSGLS